MTIPTAADLRADTRIDWAVRFGLPLPTAPDPDPLDIEIAIAWPMLEELTGRDFESMDSGYDALILRATTYMVVYMASAGRGDFGALFAETAGIISFTVPGYSETRSQARTLQSGRDWFFHPWRPLDMLLWALATQEKRDEATDTAQGKVQTPFLGFAHPEENPAVYGIERDLLQ